MKRSFPSSRPSLSFGMATCFWALACQLSFPLLVFGSLLLERHARATGPDELFFVSRDGLLWHRLHQAFFPVRRTTYFTRAASASSGPRRSTARTSRPHGT